MTSPTSMYLWPGQTYFGFGVASMTGGRVKERGGTAVLLVTDPGVNKAGLLKSIIASLQKAGLSITVFDQVPPNPDIETVNAATAVYRQNNCDFIVAVGGGSAIDAAKGVRILATGPAEATIWEYAYLYGDDRRPAPDTRLMPHLIALPTTAGTGAEATPWGIITHHERRIKFGIGGWNTPTSVALVDPELTMSLPASLTAATGMDALSHLIEAYVSTNHNPILDPMILDGIQRLGRSLPVAVAQPANREAREEVMQAAMMGGLAIASKWLGACHSLAHPLSSVANVPHGLACGLMLPHQMAYSLPGALERYAQVAAALNPAVSGSVRQKAEGAVTAVSQLLTDVALPTRLRDAGVTEDQIPELAKAAMIDLNWWTNPRTVNEGVMEQLYRQAF